jgi:hypothetical protein
MLPRNNMLLNRLERESRAWKTAVIARLFERFLYDSRGLLLNNLNVGTIAIAVGNQQWLPAID